MVERGMDPSALSEEKAEKAARSEDPSAPPAEQAAKPEEKVTYSMSPEALSSHVHNWGISRRSP